MEVQRFWHGHVPWVTPKDMKLSAIGDSSVRVAEAAVQDTPLRLIDPPAVLMVVRGMILARRVPIAWTIAPVTINQDMKALTPHPGVDAAFLARSLSSASDAFVPLIDEAGHGTRRLPTERWRQVVVALPSQGEQAAIVRFLDHADRRIRHYIRAKQKLIKLLEEQKQAIIHRAVTRGLDPDVRLKPSGVEWLGDVPEHWEVLPLRRRWQVRDCKHLTVPFVDDGIPLASVREAQPFELSFERCNRTTQEWYEKLIEGGRKPAIGDLIYCRNVSVGAAALVTTDEPFAMGQDVCLIRSRSENQRWLNYLLRSKVMFDQLATILVGSTFKRINVADIKALVVALPPRAEQASIAGCLDNELGDIDTAIGVCRSEQALLREYRTRLIADVVTGKLDVREAAGRLPEEADEPGALEEADVPIDDGEDALDDLAAVFQEPDA
jgi:type I restriction enzyme S subunit